MRKFILLLFIVLSCVTHPIAKNWYVSTASSGNASGDSWTNKKAFTSFNARSPQPGDTVFIDGGSDSLVYNLSTTLFITSTGSAANPIIYTRGKDAGHNGVPVFTSANNITLLYFDNWNGLLAKYIDWSYTKFRPANGAGMWSIVANRTTNINLYHNEIDYTYGAGIAFGMVDNVKIMYNNIYTQEVASPIDIIFIQNDAIKSNNSNNWEIAYNTIINRTSIPFHDQNGEPHRDLLQLEGHGLDGSTTRIHHNFLATFFQDDSCFTNTLKANRAGGSFIFYDNIFALYRNGGDIFTLSPNGETVPRSLYCYNNTIIQTKSKAIPSQNSYLSTVDNLVFKNNLISLEEGVFFSWSNMGATNFDFNYNQYNRTIPIASGISYSSWQSTYRQDANSETGGFTLVDNDFTTFSETATDYKLAEGSSGIDEGVDLSSIFTDDYAGTKRPVGARWDIGAFEGTGLKSGGTLGNLKANVKVSLQGPYQSNSMMTALSENQFVPSAQPYNGAPWLYNGSESLSSSLGSSSSTVVDWILVELRSAQNPAQVISRRAGLLRNDGRIMEADGSPGVTFNNVQYGSYYIAVFHRNHLAVMTSAPVLFSPDNSLYDFTNSLTKAYGQNAMSEISSGVFGMYAGDGNVDGNINDIDRNEIWSIQNGNMGYMNGDFNLDSGVTVKDINSYWNLNAGKQTQVP